MRGACYAELKNNNMLVVSREEEIIQIFDL